MRRSRGFTLVELLVVIAIIALLISILAPSLKLAKELTKQAMCATYARNIAMATIMYGESNRGNLPPFNQHPSGYGYAINAGDLQRHFKLNGTNPPGTKDDVLLTNADGTPQIHGAPGYLWVKGFIDNPGIFFCPAQRHPQFKRSSYPDPYPFSIDNPVDDGWYVHKIAYLYNLNIRPTSAPDLCVYMYTNLGTFPTDRMLAMDTILRSDFLSHTFPVNGDNYIKVNAVYIDGHVIPKSSSMAYRILVANEPGDGLYDTALFHKALPELQDK